MRVIEHFIQGKTGDEAACEDRLVVTDDFIAVIDGVTSRAGTTLQGMSTGRFAAQVLFEGIKEMHPRSTARETVDKLTARLEDHSRTAFKNEGRAPHTPWDYPAAAVLIYARHAGEIWRVGDSSFAFDGGQAHTRTLAQEETWQQLRRAYLLAQIAKGASEKELLNDDPTWSVLTPLIAEMKVFANHEGDFGYGVLNGKDVPDKYVEIFDAAGAQEIVLASDGYPEVLPTLKETEERLDEILKEDPLMYRLHPQVKGVKKGNVSFDDRSYIRFRA